MKRLTNLLLMLCLSLTALAQPKPVYERTRTDQVISDRSAWFKNFVALPAMANPTLPAYIPDSLKNSGGAMAFSTATKKLQVHDGTSFKTYDDSAAVRAAYYTKTETDSVSTAFTPQTYVYTASTSGVNSFTYSDLATATILSVNRSGINYIVTDSAPTGIQVQRSGGVFTFTDNFNTSYPETIIVTYKP